MLKKAENEIGKKIEPKDK